MNKIKKRLIELDIATGIAIFFVVLGHIASRNDPSDINWYITLKIYIYKFHMPFFMFISGAVYYYTFKYTCSVLEYFTYINKKLKRLLPGFLVFAFIIVFGKYFASFFLYVENVNVDFIDSFLKIFIYPSESPAKSLWYIYVLFELIVIFQVLIMLKNNILLLFLLSLLAHLTLYLYPISNMFMMDKIFEYSLYFSIGFIYIKNRRFILKFFLKNKQVSLLIFSLFVLSFGTIDLIPEYLSKTLIGILSIPALLIVIIFSATYSIRRVLLLFAEYSYTIYLMNTIVIGISKGLLLKFFSWGGVDFMMMVPVILFSALFIPIIIYMHIFRNTRFSTILK